MYIDILLAFTAWIDSNKLSRTLFIIDKNDVDIKKTKEVINKECQLKADIYDNLRDLIQKMNRGTKRYVMGAIKETVVYDRYDALSLMLKTINPNIKILKYSTD
jgi:hypothetical protein